MISNLQKSWPVLFCFVFLISEGVYSARVCVHTYRGCTCLWTILRRASGIYYPLLTFSRELHILSFDLWITIRKFLQPSQCMFTSHCVSWEAWRGISDFGTQNNRNHAEKPQKSHGETPICVLVASCQNLTHRFAHLDQGANFHLCLTAI